MRGMRKWKRWAVFLLLFVVLAVGGSRTAQAEMLNMTDFQDNNGTITVTKVPRGKAGNKISIKMTIHNTAEKGDNSFKTIRLANAYEYERFMTDSFGESDDEGDSGFHDASWRSKFGGTIYQYSGSHGCINLPVDKAKLLYEKVYKGMPVLCHN